MRRAAVASVVTPFLFLICIVLSRHNAAAEEGHDDDGGGPDLLVMSTTSLGYYDALLASDAPRERIGNVDVFRNLTTSVPADSTTNATTNDDGAEQSQLRDDDEEEDGANGGGDDEAAPMTTLLVCHLAIILPASYPSRSTVSSDTDDAPQSRRLRPSPGAYRHYTAAAMAAHHFNIGSGEVVPSLSGMDGGCPVRLTTEFFDTESTAVVATRRLIEASTRGVTDTRPCAVIGTRGSSLSGDNDALATVSTMYGQLHLVIDGSSQFDDGVVYPTVGRVRPSDLGLARAAVEYLGGPSGLGVTHIGLLYDKDNFGNSFDKAFQDEASRYNITVLSVPIDPLLRYDENEGDAAELTRAIDRLVRSRFRYFVGHIFNVRSVMTEAARRGLAGPGYNWLHVTGRMAVPVPAGSPLDLATHGLSFMKLEGAMESESYANYGKFLDVWSGLDENDDMSSHINSKWPKYPNDAEHNFTIPEVKRGDYSRWSPDADALYVYDSVIAAGLAACKVANATINSGNGGGGGRNETERRSPPTSSATVVPFDGRDHYDAFERTEFEGVTGLVRILPRTGSRNPDTALYAVYNLVRRKSDGVGDDDGQPLASSADGTMAYYDVRRTKFMEYDREIGGAVWRAAGERGRSHVFSDGSTIPPDPLPPVDVDMNYVGAGLRVAVLVLCGVVLLLSVACAAWTYANRRARVVRASQPCFLLMISAGTFLMGTTLIPLSIDDNIASVEGCHVACMASPWLFSVGFVVTFSALFSKLWRINKLFSQPSFVRVKVTAIDVLPPFAALLLVNAVVLTLWTVLAPLKWTRQVQARDEFSRETESYGSCKSTGNDTAYVVLLVVINFGVLIFANFQAYQARRISMEYSESRYIAFAMASIFQIFCIGIPLMVLIELPSPQLFVRAGIVTIVCLAVLLLLFVPKVIRFYRHDKKKQRRVAKVVKSPTVRATEISDTSTVSTQISEGKEATGLKVFRSPKVSQLVFLEVLPSSTAVLYNGKTSQFETNLKQFVYMFGHVKMEGDIGALTRVNKELLAEKEAWEDERGQLLEALSRLETSQASRDNADNERCDYVVESASLSMDIDPISNISSDIHSSTG